MSLFFFRKSLIFYSVVLCLVFITCIVCWSTPTLGALGFGSIIITCLVAQLYVEKKFPVTTIDELSNAKKTWFLFFFILALATRFYQLNEIPYWTDEDMHNAWLTRNKDTYYVSLLAEQPPTFYYFSLFAQKIAGFHPWAPRFFSAFFGALAVPLFFSFLLQVCKRRESAIIGSILFLSNNWFITYSKEAKPYSLSIICMIFFLYSLHEFAKKMSGVADKILFFVCSILFLLSMNLQPLVIFAVFFTVLFFYFCLQGERKKAKFLLCAAISIVALLSPFYWKIFCFSLSEFVHYRGQHNTELFRVFLFSLLHLISEYRVFLLLVPFVFLYMQFNKKGENSGLIFCYACLLFPPFYFGIYECFIAAPWQIRYLLLFLPLFITVISISIDYLFDLALKARGKREIIFIYIAFSLSLPLIFDWRTGSHPIEHKWIDLYSFFEEEKVNNAKAFMLSINRPNDFSYGGFIATDFYYSKNIKDKIDLVSNFDSAYADKDQGRLIMDAIDLNIEPDFIYFFNTHRESVKPLDDFWPVPGINVEKFSFNEPPPNYRWNSTLFKIKNTKGFAQTMEVFFKHIERQEKNNALLLSPLQILTTVFIKNKNCTEAIKYYKKTLRFKDISGPEENNRKFLAEKISLTCP